MRKLLLGVAMAIVAVPSVTAQSWLKTGNLGVLATDYLGPQNNVPLNFKVNGFSSGVINPLGATFFGYKAGSSNPNNQSVGIGFQVLMNNTTGTQNTGIGRSALESNTSGDYNTAVGNSALQSNTNGGQNTAVGKHALKLNTSGAENTAVGSNALAANTTGGNNTGVGYSVLASNTTGGNNSGFGSFSMYSNTTGADNAAAGAYSLFSNTTGYANSAFGNNALYSNTTGLHNSAAGYSALRDNVNGGHNTAVGSYALSSNTSGTSNTAIGISSLALGTIGSQNTGLGAYSDVATGNTTNATAVGYLSFCSTSNKVRLGNANVTVVEGQVAYSYPSDARFKTNVREDIPGLAFITRLRPVVYNFDTRKYDAFLLQSVPDSARAARMLEEDYAASTAILRSGFIAQEVEQAAKAVGYDFDGLHVPLHAADNYSVAYSQFVMPLVKSVQELASENVKMKERLDARDQQLQDAMKALEAAKVQLKQAQAAAGKAILEQNVPNPTNGQTTIGYDIPAHEFARGAATLNMYAESGQLVKQIRLAEAKGVVTLETAGLAAGTYVYQLMVGDASLTNKTMLVLKQ